MTKRTQKRWREYEREKNKLKAKNLPPVEYERALQAILRRLKL